MIRFIVIRVFLAIRSESGYFLMIRNPNPDIFDYPIRNPIRNFWKKLSDPKFLMIRCQPSSPLPGLRIVLVCKIVLILKDLNLQIKKWTYFKDEQIFYLDDFL